MTTTKKTGTEIKKKRLREKRIIIALLAVFVGVAGFSGYKIISIMSDYNTSETEYEGLNKDVVEKIETIDPLILNLSITNPATLIGLFVGAMLPFLFSAMTMQAVGRAAQKIVVEVRRQFREITGLLEGKAEADYETCVDICTKSSLKEMIAPAALGVFSPIIVGLVLGCNGVVGMLAGALVSGFVLAIMMANSGGAWDNAKKYIEAGHSNGKGSENHKAAVVGDTVGDPFKDTAGPSVNILIKLLSMVSIVFAGLVAAVGGLGIF